MSDAHIPPAIAKIAPDGKLTPRQARRFMIDMTLRRVRPGSGSSIKFLRRRTALNSWPDLRDILKGISWAIIGGVATRAYMPERMTKDLDILVSETNGDEVIERLTNAGYTVVTQLTIPGYLLRSPKGIEVDVLFGDEPWLSTALQHTNSDEAGYPVLDLPYLVLMKMRSSRAQDWADVSRMLGLASKDMLDKVRSVITQYNPEDSEDLESLIHLGRLELKSPPSEEND